MKRLKTILLSLLFIGGFSLMPAIDTAAVNVFDQVCGPGSESALCASQDDSADSMIQPIVALLLWAVGVVSIIVIIVGGIMFATSAGDPGRAKKAKDAILYAVVGLAVAILSYAIVEFVVGRL